MRVIVTGGAGYVGSHTVRALLDAGYQPAVFDNLSKGHRQAVPSEVPVYEGDLADKGTIKKAFASFRPEAVMHFAGSTQVGESVANPGLYFRNNIASPLNLLDAMVEHKVDRLVFSSTAAVYGEPSEIPIPEDHPKVPTNPYGESKLFFESILHRYEVAFGIRSMALRYFNAAGAHPSGEIGEDHTPETHLIPIILQVALGQREQVTVFGTDYATDDGTCVRDYVHVCDLAAAHILAVDALASGAESNAFNLGNGKGFSVQQVIDEVERVVGKPVRRVTGERRPGDPAVLVASSEKARRVLGWQPSYPDLASIIETAWQWHSRHPEGYGA